MKYAGWFSLVSALVMLAPAVASAGLLDKLNEATKKMELNMAYSTVHNKIMAECNAMDHMEVHRTQ